MNRKSVWVLAAALLAGCGDEPPPSEPKPPEGRAETRAIRNTEAVGYSGGAIADKVDTALDQNEEARKRREAADAQSAE